MHDYKDMFVDNCEFKLYLTYGRSTKMIYQGCKAIIRFCTNNIYSLYWTKFQKLYDLSEYLKHKKGLYISREKWAEPGTALPPVNYFSFRFNC